MPTSTQRFRLVGEDDASRAFLEVAAASRLLKSSMDDVSSSALGLGKLMGGASLIPIMAGAVAATTELTTSLGAASGALGVFGLSAGGIGADMLKQQKAIDTLDTKLSGLTKGTDEYRQTAQQLHVAQQNFNADFGPAAKGLDSMKESWAGFKDATRDVTTGVMGKGFDLIASVLPKLVPVSNAAGRAVGGLIDDLSQWTEGSSFKHLLHFLETSGPKDITAFGHSIGNVLGGLGGILSNFVGPGDDAAKTLEHLTENFDKWGHSKGVSQDTKAFLKYVRDNGPEISSTFRSLAEASPKIATALGRLGSSNLSVMSRFLNLIAGMPQGAFNVVATGLFAIAAGSKAITAVTGIGAIATGIKGIAGGKGLAGRVGGTVAGSVTGGVQKVFVVNMGAGGIGGSGGTGGAVGWLKAAPLIGTTIAAALYSKHFADTERANEQKQYGTNDIVKIAQVMLQRKLDAAGVTQMPRTQTITILGKKLTVPAVLPDIKSIGTHLDAVKQASEKASTSLELIGPRAKTASKVATSALDIVSKGGLDPVSQHAADASRKLDLIGPHTRDATRTAVSAVGSLSDAIRGIPDKRIQISANTSQAMDNLRVMKYQLDQLHDKTIIVRAIGGHVPGEPSSAGGGAGGGSSKSFRGMGRGIMDGIVDGIADRKLSLENALNKVGDLVSKMKDKVSRLTSTQAGFKHTFASDNVFGTDLSGGGGIEAIISARAAQADQASQLLADVKQAGKLGLSKSLIRQLQAQGTSGAAALHAIVTGSPDRIALLNSLDKQTNASLAAAGIRAGNQVRGGSIADDIRRAQKQEHTLELLERRLHELAQHMKKDQTITVEIDGEAVITSIVKRNKRKGVKSAGV
jgi:hypothetical protein